MNTKDLAKFLAANLTYEDVICRDEYAKGYAEGWRDGRFVSRPQGEWIVSNRDSICSVCGKDEVEFICGTEDWYGYGLSNYCPNCGARMKGADDEHTV